MFLIINRLTLAGGSMDTLSMAFHLADRYDITIIYGEKERDETDTPLPLSHPLIRFVKIDSLQRSALPFRDLISLRKIGLLIRKEKPSIVHTTGFKPGFTGRIAAKLAGVPVIIHTYHGHVFHSYYNAFVSAFIIYTERMLARFCTDQLIAVSPQQAHEIGTLYHIAPQRKITTIFIGVETNNDRLSLVGSGTLRAQYGIDKSKIIIAIIGRLVPVKNHSLFIDIAKQITGMENEVCFFIIGDGYCKPALQKELDEKGICWQEGEFPVQNANVYFTSWIADIGTALRDIDIVVLTSHNEGTPVSLIEAQLFGLPVVATNVGGVRDTLIDGESGFLVSPGDADEFAKLLRQLIHDKTLRTSMGKTGKQFAQQRFSRSTEVNEVDALYRRCLQLKNILT